MTISEAVAYVQSQTACAMAEIEAMKAANQYRAMQGYSQAYGEEAFLAVPDKYMISHNAVCSVLHAADR